MRFAVFLVSLFALITGFLLSRRIPRPLVFAVLLASATIYALSFFTGLWVIYGVRPNLLDGFVPYFLPLPFVALYIVWALRRHKARDDGHTGV
jgi:CHASE2 domain-containing sensor protein